MKLDLAATIETGEGPAYMPIDTHKAIIRSDGKHIGTVGADYELEQPFENFQFFDQFITSGLVDLEAGGSLKGGSRMWALGKIRGAESDVVKNDAVKSYLLAATSFDGSMSKVIKFTSTRVVCQNTLSIAMRENATEWKIRHTKGLKDRVANVGHIVAQALNDHHEAIEQYKILASKPASYEKLKAYVRTVIVGELKQDEKPSTMLENKAQRVIELIDTQKGLDLVPAIRGTMWQGYNAVTEYLTHEAGRNEDNRLNNQWFGETAKLNQHALNLALSY